MEHLRGPFSVFAPQREPAAPPGSKHPPLTSLMGNPLHSELDHARSLVDTLLASLDHFGVVFVQGVSPFVHGLRFMVPGLWLRVGFWRSLHVVWCMNRGLRHLCTAWIS